MIAPISSFATPALSGMFAARGLTAVNQWGGAGGIDKNNAQSAGDLPPNAWGEEKAHTRDPTPTQLDPNDPKAKQTHIPQSESFAEYMARRNGGAAYSAPAAAAPAPAAPQYSAPAAPAAPSYNPGQSYNPGAQSAAPSYNSNAGYNPGASSGRRISYNANAGYNPRGRGW